MKIHAMPVGPIGANCYIVSCEETGEGFVIDPGAEGSRIAATIQKLGVKVRYIINTHGHADHIGGNRQVKEATGAEIVCHKLETPMLADPQLNLSMWLGEQVVSPDPDREVDEGDTLEVGSLKLTFLFTPGHTRGGMCIRTGDSVFTGDTLFMGSIGRTDFPGGSYNTLMNSIQKKLLTLPDDVKVYSGHGPASTIAEERTSNPFLGDCMV